MKIPSGLLLIMIFPFLPLHLGAEDANRALMKEFQRIAAKLKDLDNSIGNHTEKQNAPPSKIEKKISPPTFVKPLEPTVSSPKQNTPEPLTEVKVPTTKKPYPRRWSDAKPKVVKRPIGSYFFSFRPNVHFSQDLDYDFTFGPEGTIDSKTGHGIAFEFGREFGGWEFLLDLGYDRTRLGNLSWMGSEYQAKGNVSAYHLMIGSAKRFALSDKVNLRAGLSLGLANRHDHYELSALLPNTIDEENLAFRAKFGLLLDFEITESFHLSAGYGIRHLNGSDGFSRALAHSLELGGTWHL